MKYAFISWRSNSNQCLSRAPFGSLAALRLALSSGLVLGLSGCLVGGNVVDGMLEKSKSGVSEVSVPTTAALTTLVSRNGTGGSGGAFPAADCSPTFENIGAEHTLWPQTDFGLPTVVTQSKIVSHPSGGSHYMRVFKTASHSSASSMGATNYLHHIPEYSQHDAFSADGTYLVSHGISDRALFNAKTNQNVRVISFPGAHLGDWQWHPQLDNIAFYFDRSGDRVIRYNADLDTHDVLFDFGATPITVDGIAFSDLGTLTSGYAMGGQGSITVDGSQVAVLLNGSGDGIVAHLDLASQTVINTIRFAGKDTSDELDVATISPDGRYIMVLGDFNNIYGTSFSRRHMYKYDTQDFRLNNKVLVLGRSNHFDVGINADGDPVMVTFGYVPSGGWAGNTTDAGVGLVAGVAVLNLRTDVSRQIFSTQPWGNGGLPAGHISMPLDGVGVALISLYQGGHGSGVSFAQNNALIAIDIDNDQIAWMGWDEGANPGIGSPGAGPAGAYYAQPHASFVMDAELSDGSRGWKVAWGSDNRSLGSRSELFTSEVVCD